MIESGQAWTKVTADKITNLSIEWSHKPYEEVIGDDQEDPNTIFKNLEYI